MLRHMIVTNIPLFLRYHNVKNKSFFPDPIVPLLLKYIL